MSTSTGWARGLQVPVGAPSGFEEHSYLESFTTPHPISRVWAWLNDPATFIEGQIWPYRVEFVGGGFEPGVLNVHYGPLILFAGAIGEVRSPEEGDGVGFRDLRYFYGSYAISPRLVRPTRLRFWAEERDGATLVTVRLDSFVRGGCVGPWDYAQRIFWGRFLRWLDSSL